MTEPTPRVRQARPVWDARVVALVEQSDRLAKGWLIELVDRRPLADAEQLLAGRVARFGPPLCEGLVRAIASDEALIALAPGGELAPGLVELSAFVDAHGSFELSAALELLRGVLSSAVRRILADPEPELVWAVAERLALVLEIARGTALTGLDARGPDGGRVADPRDPDPHDADPRDAVAGPGIATPITLDHFARLEVDRCADAERGRDGSSPGGHPAEVLGAGEWIEALDDAIADARRRMSPLALLMVELEEPGRILAALGGERASEVFREFRSAVLAQLRRGDFLVEESGTRLWVLSRNSTRGAAHDHAARIADAIARLQPWHGAPPAASIGLAVLGEDAMTAEGLAEAAEEAGYAASAAGLMVGPPLD